MEDETSGIEVVVEGGGADYNFGNSDPLDDDGN